MAHTLEDYMTELTYSEWIDVTFGPFDEQVGAE